jgi:N-acetylglucosaminyldiphosphoundecaprenol N-acetyl-beta-D-mannosaminyltransferase
MPASLSGTIDVCGVRIDAVDLQGAVERVVSLVREGTPRYVVTPNVDHIVKLRRDPSFRQAYRGASVVLADGVPVLWASRLLGRPLAAKVSGSDLFPALCARAADEGLSVFFLGGQPGAAELAQRKLEARSPRLRVVGTHCPPRGFEHDPVANGRALDAVRTAAPDLLFVALGAPKQEKWLHAHLHELGVPVSLGIGASLDFQAGLVRRAPRWMQRSGLEWSYRLLQEPRRMWRRYLLEDPWFMYYVARQLWAERGQRRLEGEAGW